MPQVLLYMLVNESKMYCSHTTEEIKVSQMADSNWYFSPRFRYLYFLWGFFEILSFQDFWIVSDLFCGYKPKCIYD